MSNTQIDTICKSCLRSVQLVQMVKVVVDPLTIGKLHLTTLELREGGHGAGAGSTCNTHPLPLLHLQFLLTAQGI